MGQHTREVLSDVAGMSDNEVSELVAANGAFEQIEPETLVSRPWNDWIHLFLPGVDDARDL